MPFDFNKLWILSSLQLMVLVVPGVSFAIVVRNSMVSGLIGGLSTALGISLAIAFHVIFSILGSTFISDSGFLFYILRCGGGVYLLWLSYKFWQSSNKPKAQRDGYFTTSSGMDHSYKIYQFVRMGFLVDILNPYIFLFHFSTFINVLSPLTPWTQKSIFASTIIAISFVWFSLVALVLSNSKIERQLINYGKWIEKCIAVALIWFSYKLFF